MNIEQEVFKRRKICFDKLLEYGFQQEGNHYVYSTIFMDGFRADIKIDQDGFVSGKVYDLDMEEEYTNFRIQGHLGEFVGSVRDHYQTLLENIRDHISEKQYFITEQANRITKFILSTYHDEPEFAWEKSPGFGIFRNPDNQKWYGLMMNIDYSKLDPNKHGEIEAINIKLAEDEIPTLLTKDGFYPCYHMNKKMWITIVLDDTLEDKEIEAFIQESHRFTESSHEWIIPANPKYYDIISEFEYTDTVLWKQSNNIHVGDYVYLYVGSPYSSILYKCVATEVQIPYQYHDSNLDMKYVMRLQLIEKYKEGVYSFQILNQYGVRAVRGPRSMPKKLSAFIHGESHSEKEKMENYEK